MRVRLTTAQPFIPVTRFVRVAGMSVLATAALSSCHSAPGTPSGQVVAVVDGTEITTAQLQQTLQSLPISPDSVTPAVQASAIQSLIDQTLLQQQAEKLDLGQRPEVARALESARRQVLVQSYVDRLSSPRPPNDEAIQRYYDEHPGLYANRRTYTLTDLPVAVSGGIERYTAAFHRPDATVGSIASELKNNGIDAAVTTTTASSDSMPPDLADALSKLNTGDNVAFTQDEVRHFMHIDAVNNSPVPLSLATPRIAERIQGEAKMDRGKAEIARLRKTADIKLGEVGRSVMAKNKGT